MKFFNDLDSVIFSDQIIIKFQNNYKLVFGEIRKLTTILTTIYNDRGTNL